MKSAKVLKILHISRQTLVKYVQNKEIMVVELPNGFYDYNDDDVYRKVGLANERLNIMRKVVGDSYVSRIVNSGHSLCPVRHRSPFFRAAGSMQKVE